jgi:hypothetical protein
MARQTHAAPQSTACAAARRSALCRGSLLAAAMLALGCATPPPPQTPQARSATPTSINRHEPGGDAVDAHSAALERLRDMPIGTKIDKFRTIKARFPDAENWTRVRFWGHPTRAGFRYGKAGHAIAVIKYFDAEGDDAPTSCLDRFLREAQVQADQFSIDVAAVQREAREHYHSTEWRALQRLPEHVAAREAAERREAQRRKEQPHLRVHRIARPRMGEMPVARTEGRFTTLLNRDHYLAAVAAYRSWPGTCLVQAFAVRVEHDRALAEQVTDRWLDYFAPRLAWSFRLHEAPPFANR